MNPELTGYLLGTLADDRREAIAQQLITDPELLAELELLEADLIDQYSRGELDPADAKLVRSRLLSSQHGANELRLARALALGGTARPSKKAPVRTWLVAAAVAAILLAGPVTWLLRHRGANQPALEPGGIAVILELSAVRGNARVPQIHLPQTGPVYFVVRTDAPIPDGAIAHLRTPDRRDLALPIRASDQSFHTPDATPLPGRYEVEITSGTTLIAAGQFDLIL